MHFHMQKSDVPVNQDTVCACTKTPCKYKDIFSIMQALEFILYSFQHFLQV